MSDEPNPIEPPAPLCGAWLLIGDDHGDNEATIQCSLPPHESGDHAHAFQRDGGEQRVRIQWSKDEGHLCPVHGRMAGKAGDCWRCLGERFDREEKEDVSFVHWLWHNCPATSGARSGNLFALEPIPDEHRAAHERYAAMEQSDRLLLLQRVWEGGIPPAPDSGTAGEPATRDGGQRGEPET